ncbi:sulfotransferase [Parasphingopyxis sp. CP4]|uniref:sulfotransferase n=1 Tax=Parasphingopyxis sp. CP4 TaxID=2724527 RepID=UPI0015A14299|nr:sulfotransferase [Parasphingopyxis sp. CP4]QLC22507.1 sulfotransferase [Parasphingopyxis sp. CP4]
MIDLERCAPVIIGGVGGSGTRLVASLVEGLGVFLGGDLNVQRDNQLFTYLFVRPEIVEADKAEFRARARILAQAIVGPPLADMDDRKLMSRLSRETSPHGPMAQKKWIRARYQAWLENLSSGREKIGGPWGWKEPNSHIVLTELIDAMPNMRYIHVARNGLDMAFSSNHQQVQTWGEYLLDRRPVLVDTRDTLKYWCRVHKRTLLKATVLNERFLLLDYDRLCGSPHREISRLGDFLNVKCTSNEIDELAANITAPKSIGRFRQFGLADFDEQDVAYVASQGFETA